MSSSVASFLSLSIGAPSARDRADRRDRGEKDTGLSDFFKILSDGMFESAKAQMGALGAPSTKAPDLSTREGIVEALAQSEAKLRESLLGMSSLSGQGSAHWPASFGSKDDIFAGLQGFGLPKNDLFSAFEAFAPSKASVLSAYQQFKPADRETFSGNALIEDALRTIATGLGKPLEEVRKTHFSGFKATA